MDKKLLLHEEDKIQKVKEIAIVKDPQKLKMILNRLSWKILVMLSEREMYPLEIAKKLGIHEQKVYYHIRKLARAGVITVTREEKKKGAIAKYYK
ncbi:MAG: helix-turn-helix domain-containing protein, partial [Candidatus Bathyarchaeia archaeon]|nr:helix-turn-helix domain-containing protein [Candidatus Bathyarchaeia archaeon]